MASVGWSTLDVIPSVKGLAGELDRQTRGPMASAGRKSGRQFGDAAGKEAGTRFGASLRTGLRTIAAPLAGIAAGLGGARIFGDMIAEAQEAAKVTRITQQLVRTTGGAANLTASQVGNLATSLSKYAAIDDEVVQSGENVLLTFRNVRNEIGSGNNIFDRATKAALDMSTVLGTDLNGAMLQLGKALNDPIKGMAALGRAGVQFSADQKAQVKAFVANNDLLSAQKLVLGELEHQVGGAAGANATALDQLGVAFKNLEEAAGTALAPALNKIADVTAQNVIPAMESAGGTVGDIAHGFGQLPTPIKAATGALIAFRAAQALGAGGLLAGGGALLSRGLDDVRLRAMALSDEYKRLRQGQLDIIQGSGKFTPAAGRMASALGAVEVAAIGAGRGIKAGLSGALSLVGGPWGAAFIAGTAIVAHFWQEHQKAKARVESMTEALDKQTGALTADNRELAFKALQDSGAIDAAKKMSLSLSLLTDAALGNKGAINAVNVALDQNERAIFSAAGVQGRANGAALAAVRPMQTIREALDGQNSELAKSKTDWRDHAEAMKTSTTTTDSTAAATDTYTSKLKAARDAVRGLMDAERKRKDANLGAFQDQTRLAQALADARKEAKDGARTLDVNAEAGRKNRDALASLADAWNSSADSVKNAKGAYADMRQNLIDVAKQMGAGDMQARNLANRLLDIPKNTPVAVTTPGMKAALENVRKLKEELRAAQALSRIVITAQAGGQRQNRDTFATGGMVGGVGSGTSDSNLIWASRGEFMQRKAAVDYYGVDFMRRLNSLQVPKYADGGLIGGGVPVTAPSSVVGHEIVGLLSWDRDGMLGLRAVIRDELAADDQRRMNRRRSTAIGGVPR